MVRAKLVDNMSTKLVDEFPPLMAQSRQCRVAVAFVSTVGLSLIEPHLEQCLEKGGTVEFLVGLDASATDPNALWTLHQKSQSNPSVTFYCYGKLGTGGIYHPKLYIADLGAMKAVVIGSSNLTEGGLRTNIEANILIEADSREEVVSDAYAAYNMLKFHPKRVRPNEQLLSLYADLHRFEKRQQRAVGRNPDLRRLRSRFEEEAALLEHPHLTDEDLFGWQRLVYERLPEGQFTTRDVYSYEGELARYYPENRNVRAKIRQVLQQLRDLGLLQHIDKGTWIKAGRIDEACA